MRRLGLSKGNYLKRGYPFAYMSRIVSVKKSDIVALYDLDTYLVKYTSIQSPVDYNCPRIEYVQSYQVKVQYLENRKKVGRLQVLKVALDKKNNRVLDLPSEEPVLIIPKLKGDLLYGEV